MANQSSIECTYHGSTMIYGPKINQAFDSCKLEDGWIKVGIGVHPSVRKYMAIREGAKAILRLFNTKTPEILKFQKGSTIKLSTKIIQYHNKHKLKN